MNLYTPEYLREWHRRGTLSYVNCREHDAPSGFGNVPVMQVLHAHAREQLPELNEELLDWLGAHDGVDCGYDGWRLRGSKLILDWAAEVYCLYLLVTVATQAGVPAHVAYSASDDYRGVDCRITLFGREHFVQLERRPWAGDNADDLRKYFRRLARGQAEPCDTLHWRPPFDELDRACQPWVPRSEHAWDLLAVMEQAA